MKISGMKPGKLAGTPEMEESGFEIHYDAATGITATVIVCQKLDPALERTIVSISEPK